MVSVKRTILRDDIYEVLLDRLMSGMYEPDTQLSIDQLARDLDVSPTPVREAMVELENTGLVCRVALKGYRVAAPLSPQQMSQIIDVRKLLEVAAAERAFDQLEILMPHLESAFERHQNLGVQLQGKHGAELDYGTLRPYFEADWAFHQVILNHCGNLYLAKTVENLSFNVHRMRQTLGRGVSDSLEATCEHQKIVDGYRAKSPTQVRNALVDHLNGVLERSLSEL